MLKPFVDPIPNRSRLQFLQGKLSRDAQIARTGFAKASRVLKLGTYHGGSALHIAEVRQTKHGSRETLRISRVFFAMNGCFHKRVHSIRRCVRAQSNWLHRIRAETLFTLSACLRRQIFIPYAPISRSQRVGESRPEKWSPRCNWFEQGIGDLCRDCRGNEARARAINVRLCDETNREFLDSKLPKSKSIRFGNEHNLYSLFSLGDTTP